MGKSRGWDRGIENEMGKGREGERGWGWEKGLQSVTYLFSWVAHCYPGHCPGCALGGCPLQGGPSDVKM